MLVFKGYGKKTAVSLTQSCVFQGKAMKVGQFMTSLTFLHATPKEGCMKIGESSCKMRSRPQKLKNK